MDRTQSEGHQAFMFTAKTFRRRIASDGQLGHLDSRAKFGSSGVIYKCRMPPHPGQTGPMRTAYLIHLIKTIPQQLQRNKCKR